MLQQQKIGKIEIKINKKVSLIYYSEKFQENYTEK